MITSAEIITDPRLGIGGNSPPAPLDEARISFKALSDFVIANPVIETEDQARAAKRFLDQGARTIASIEDAQKAESAPLHAAWKEAIARYKPALGHCERIVSIIKDRLTTYMRAEEDRRSQDAEQIRLAALKAEQAAADAARAEAEAQDNAEMGEFTDVIAAMEASQQTASAAAKLNRQAIIAEKDVRVRLGGGLGKTTTLRNKEILAITDPVKAIAEIGLTADISEAILKGARAFRKLRDRLPDGIVSEIDRSL